jgi:cell wall-associated NlpC family hydrolase
MGKKAGLVCLFFFAWFFVVGQACAAAAHKIGATDTARKTLKKHRPKVQKNVRATETASPEAAESVAPPDKSQKKSLKSKKTRTRTAKKATPEIQEAASQEKDDGEYIEYRLKRGETINSVAERFNIDSEEIVDLNQAGKKRLKMGSIVLVPRTETESEDEPVAASFGGSLKPWKDDEERGILVKVAKSFAGAPYRYGGDTVRGLDCSAFVRKMYEIFEVELPRSAREQFWAGQRVNKEDLMTGDLVFFRTKRYAKYPTHVGIYIGDDKFIHSSSTLSKGVKVDRLSDGYFARTFTGAVRVKAPPIADKTETKQSVYAPSGNS